MYDEKCLRQIGGNVKYLRSACHITQQELAARIGISQTHLCNLEHDHARISMKLLLRIANTLGCALEVLLDTKAAVAWGENRDEPEMEAVEEEEALFAGRSAPAAANTAAPQKRVRFKKVKAMNKGDGRSE